MSMLNDIQLLVNDGLVVTRYHKELPLVLFKYHNKVFYNNLWSTSPLLTECRGIVFNLETGGNVQRPFHKIFNVGENGTQEPSTDICTKVMKVNGFMAAATFYNGGLLVTTTGSFDSDYQLLALSYLDKLNWTALTGIKDDWTYLFEVCDPSDPHIVNEQHGAYLLGIRNKADGRYMTQDQVSEVASDIGALRPLSVLSDQKEGWVYYDHNGTPLAKSKTPHYLSKKALMRMGKRNVGLMFNNPEQFRQRLDEEFYEIHSFLIDRFTEEEYSSLTEQDRRTVIEDYFNVA